MLLWGDSVEFWDHVKTAEELGCRVDELLVYYGGDLWNPDGDDIGYTGNYDGQSESSDYKDPRDSCEFHCRMDLIFRFRRMERPHYRSLKVRPGRMWRNRRHR